MSKAARETILSTLFSYLGVALGAFSTIFIIPNLFHEHPENYGTLLFLVNYVWIFLIFSSLGTPHCIIKFYPINKTKDREEILSFLFILNILGIIFASLIFYFYTKNEAIELVLDGTTINISYFFYPLLISMTFFNFFQSYCHALLKVAVPAFLNNTFVRFWFFLILIFYYYDWISFTTFSYLYFGQYIASFVVLVLFVWRIKKDKFSLRFKIPQDYKTILKYALFILPTTTAAVLITKIDIQMIERFLDEEQIAYYSNALFFMSVLLIPKNAIMHMARSVFSRDFQNQTLEIFRLKYTKVSFLFLWASLTVFIGIAINIEDLMLLLGNKFGNNNVKYAILILGIGRVVESALVSNHAVLEYSKHYKKIPLFEVTSLVLLIILNLVMIPKYGIVGAALSSAFIFVLNGFAKTLFVYQKLQLIPIRKADFTILICTFLLLGVYFIPLQSLGFLENIIANTLLIISIRCIIFAVAFIIIIESFGIRKKYFNFKEK